MNQGMMPTLVNLIRSARIDLSDEKRAQGDVASLLADAGIPFECEVRLSGSDIVDFLVEEIGLELKLLGAEKKAVYRQLCRYARHPRIGSLLLASNLSMGLPPQITLRQGSGPRACRAGRK